MTNKAARFLILRGGAIGDFVMTLPALTAVRSRWPSAYIELVGYTHIAKLAQSGGLVDAVSALDGMDIHQLYAWRPAFSERLMAFIRSFDVVLTYLHDPDGIVLENLELIGAKDVLCGTPLPEDKHASEHLMEPLASLAIYPTLDEDGQLPVTLRIGDASREQGQHWLGQHVGADVIAIHPGSGSPKKNWPLDRYIDLAGRIKAAGTAKPLFMVGEADQEIAAQLECGPEGLPILKNRQLEEVAGVLSACTGYVGNDSGITHLAAALGTPTLSLFGPTDVHTWAPRGRHVQVLEAPNGDLHEIITDDVLPALGKLLA